MPACESATRRAVSRPSIDLAPSSRMRVGIDLVPVAEIERSLADFGPRFAARLFAAGELAESTVDGRLDAGALAQRFAAKEATIKAFDLCDAGIGWTQIEVVHDELARDRRPVARVRLHGRAAESAARSGSYEIAASLSRDGDLACAIVVARRA